ncbi:MAG: hypothetical protein AB7O73_12665, partial [Bacteroidia bacterium]
SKIDFKIVQNIPFKIKGYFKYALQAGKVFGNVPYSLQFNNNPSRANNYPVSADNSFETMYYNEFISTYYGQIFTYINSGRLLKSSKTFNPEIELVNNIGYDVLENKENLINIPLNDLSKIYTESGIRFRGLFQNGFSDYGLGFFYRYGAYQESEWKKNLVVKLTYGFRF